MGVIRGRLSPYAVYLILAGARAFLFALIFTAESIYQITVAGLNPLQLVLVGTTLEAAAFLFEVPTGVVADVYSRRLSIIIGFTLMGVAFVLEGSVPRFWAILAAMGLWGLGHTFTSGAQQAWIADELGEAGIGRVYLRAAQVGQAGTLVGLGVGAVLGSWRLNLPIVLGGALLIALAGFLALTMTERGFRPAPRAERSSWGALGATLRAGLGLARRRPTLLTILAIALIGGAASEGFDRLWRFHLLNGYAFPSAGGFAPVVWFSLINAVALLLTIGATEIARRRIDTDSHRAVARALFASDALLIAGIVAFGLAGNFALAVAAYLAITILRRVAEPLQAAWLNQSLEPRVRATMFSMQGQADALGQIGGGPILGLIATAVSVPIALVAAGGFLTPALVLYARTVRSDGSGEEREGPVG